jgi:DNA-binding MurR/RpiR family transcriptional regulator
MKELQEVINHAKLTKTQKIIAEFVLDHSSEACFMTSTNIAMELGVSDSSVIRFSRSLGFSGFMDFQKSLQRGYQDKVLSISSAITVPAQRIAKSAKLESYSEYMHQHFKNAAKNMEAVLSENSISIFEEVADILISSNYKYIMASRGNVGLADYFLLYAKHMLPNVIHTSSHVCVPFDIMSNINEKDCFLIFSFPRYSSLDELSCKMAKDSGAKIIVITDKPSATLAKYATTLITVPVDSNAFFNSIVAVQFVSEAILDTISHKVTGIDKRLEKIDKYLEKLGTY